jgi:hypothetical protein
MVLRLVIAKVLASLNLFLLRLLLFVLTVFRILRHMSRLSNLVPILGG